MKALFSRIHRLLNVVMVLVLHFALPFLFAWRRRGATAGAVRLRTSLETLGGAWIKLGQSLALRFDLLPPAYCYELFKLLDKVKSFPYEQVRNIIKEDLGSFPEVIFRSFQSEPFAAASIGQVHRATLHSGEAVAVKIQRPDIRAVIRTDIRWMYFLAHILDRMRLLGDNGAQRIVSEFEHWTEDELDYLIEARHAARFRKNSRNYVIEKIPRVYWNFTSQRVLATELLEGVRLTEIMCAISNRDDAYLTSFRSKGYDVRSIVKRLDWNLFNQVYVDGLFHADLHPANLFVLPGNAIGYVDFGIVGKLSGTLRRTLINYSWLLFQGRVDETVEQLLHWVEPSTRTDRVKSHDELVLVVKEYVLSLRKSTSAKCGASAFAIAILKTMRRHSLVLKPSLVTYFKALIAADAIRYELVPDYDLQRLANRFFRGLFLS